jgi:hypothetical protein
VALTLTQQLDLIDFYDAQVEKISYLELGAWAKREFGLHQAPSKGFISKLLKNKEAIVEKAAETLRLDRKRKKPLNNADLDTLEKTLLDWVHYHDAAHGGRIPLSDAMLIEQVCSREYYFTIAQHTIHKNEPNQSRSLFVGEAHRERTWVGV